MQAGTVLVDPWTVAAASALVAAGMGAEGKEATVGLGLHLGEAKAGDSG